MLVSLRLPPGGKNDPYLGGLRRNVSRRPQPYSLASRYARRTIGLPSVATLYQLYEMTTSRKFASPPRWVRSRRPSWRWTSGYAPVPRSRDCVQDAFSEGQRSGRASNQIATVKKGLQLPSSAEQRLVALRVLPAHEVGARHRRVAG